jgi:hypothetical protein
MGLLATVLGALRRFLPDFLKTEPPLSPQQHRALWAITHCRTAALGGRTFVCPTCEHLHFAYHSCNHKACPQCGAQATQRWIRREMAKRINAPYFLVTFTLPAQLRGAFFGPLAKQAYDLFFTAVASALSEKLAADKGLRAPINGFTAILHTWNQRLEFHPHIHCLVPGAGLDAQGQPVRVKKPQHLVYLPHMQSAYRQHLYRLLKEHHWPVDPQVWRQDWGVHIQPVGSAISALKYLSTYVARTAITDARILKVTEQEVTFRWKDRAQHNLTRTLTLPGMEFVRRYLRHVLPRGLRSVRYYGFCHPTAKANRLRVQFHSGMPVDFGATEVAAGLDPVPALSPRCPQCGHALQPIHSWPSARSPRGPPRAQSSPLIPSRTV